MEVTGQPHALAALPPGESSRDAPYIGRPIGGPKGVEKRKMSCPVEESAFKPVATRYADWAIPAPWLVNSGLEIMWKERPSPNLRS
jgi:hypothetical protein